MYLVSFYLFCANDYKPQSRLVVDNSTKKRYSAISFTTMQLPCFNEYRELFYDLNRKKNSYRKHKRIVNSPSTSQVQGPLGLDRRGGLAFLIIFLILFLNEVSGRKAKKSIMLNQI